MAMNLGFESANRVNCLPSLQRDFRPCFAYDAQPDMCSIWLDDEGIILDCGDDLVAFSGYRWEQVIGRRIDKLLPELRQLTLLQAGEISTHLQVLCGNATPFRVVHADGHLSCCQLAMQICVSETGPVVVLTVRNSAPD